MTKITHEEFDKAIHEYYSNYEDYKELRLGQYLMNTLVAWEKNTEIFYAENDKLAANLFLSEYVE